MIEASGNKRLAALIEPSPRQIFFVLDRFESVSEQVKRGLRVLKAFVATVKVNLGDIEDGLGIDPELGSADSGDVETDLSELLVAVAQAAASRQTAIAIIIDEVRYLRKA